MKRIAVLCKETGEVDIITPDKKMKSEKSIEKYLTDHCNYDLDNISWMPFDGDIHFYTDSDFGQ